MELQQGLRGHRTAAVVSCIGQRFIVKLPICGSKIRQNLANANYSNLPLLWPPAVKDARAAKRNKWRGPAQRGGGRLCRLRVSLRAGGQSSTQRVDMPGGATTIHCGATAGYQGRKPLPSLNSFEPMTKSSPSKLRAIIVAIFIVFIWLLLLLDLISVDSVFCVLMISRSPGNSFSPMPRVAQYHFSCAAMPFRHNWRHGIAAPAIFSGSG